MRTEENAAGGLGVQRVRVRPGAPDSNPLPSSLASPRLLAQLWLDKPAGMGRRKGSEEGP